MVRSSTRINQRSNNHIAMKTKQLSTGIATLLLIELPEGSENAIGIGFNEHGTLEFYTPQPDAPPMLQALYKLNVGSNWQLLCKADEVTEGIAREFVRKVTLGYYFDYMKPNRRHDYMCATPGESWNSLLQANEVWFENPYKQIDKKYFNKVHFENTQQNVWEINRTYIFKQI